MNKPLLVVVFLALAVLFYLQSTNSHVFGSTALGLAAGVASTSRPTIGTAASLIAATSSCSSRIITTYASPIMLTFTERGTDVPTALIGHLQAASTTVVYPAEVYGCDALQGYGFVSTVNYVTETR